MNEAKRKRRTLVGAEATRHGIEALLRNNPLLSYVDIAKVAKKSEQRVCQIAHEEGLDVFRKEWKEKLITRPIDRIKLPEIPPLDSRARCRVDE